MRRIAVALLVLLVVLGTGSLAFAPYLPQLIREGSPPLIWGGIGAYAEVKGALSPAPLGPGVRTELEPKLGQLFDETGGTALLLAHRGALQLEHYGAGATEATRLNSFSMVKSLVSALVFRAIAEGRIKGLDQTLADLLPAAPGLQALTLRRLLTMRSWVHFDTTTTSFGGAGSSKDSDTLPNPFGPLARLHFQGLDAILGGLTMDQTPSDDFLYQNVNTALLGAVLERAYGRPLQDLLSEKIWRPAGAPDAVWRMSGPDASVSAYCCLYATARDWIRIGMFFEANGTPAAPFLPVALWREFLGLDVQAEARAHDHYGNHTLQNILDRPGEDLQGPFTYFMGQNGQILYIKPDDDLVVHRAGERIQLLHTTLYGAWNSIR